MMNLFRFVREAQARGYSQAYTASAAANRLSCPTVGWNRAEPNLSCV